MIATGMKVNIEFNRADVLLKPSSLKSVQVILKTQKEKLDQCIIQFPNHHQNTCGIESKHDGKKLNCHACMHSFER